MAPILSATTHLIPLHIPDCIHPVVLERWPIVSDEGTRQTPGCSRYCLAGSLLLMILAARLSVRTATTPTEGCTTVMLIATLGTEHGCLPF
jgi:hypothetical protein